jgi:hypothetical protein
MTPLQVTAQLLPGGHLVLLEIGEDGPHWVLSAADARSVGWALIDAANGHEQDGGVLVVQDRHLLTPRDIPPAGNRE